MSNVTNLYEFLREFNKIKNKSITNVMEYKDLINLDSIIQSKYITLYDINENEQILTVELVDLIEIPKIPLSLEGWLKIGYKDFKIENADVYDKILIKENNIEKELDFYDDERRVKDFFDWNKLRIDYVNENKIRDEAKSLFRKIYTLKTEIDSEAETYELVYADYVLEMKYKEGYFKHPLFIKKVNIEYDEKSNSIDIQLDEGNIELYSNLLRQINEFNPNIIRQINEKIEENSFDFSAKLEIKEFSEMILRFIRNSIDNSSAILYEKPMLFKRRKNQGYAKFIDLILDDLDDKGELELPKFMKDLLYHSEEGTNVKIEKIESAFDGLDKDILLTLPANEEQLRIVKCLQTDGAVLVQGPPGTGKTHTIANLIGHLLSDGKTILVTSQTEKALSVLKEKVFKDDEFDLRSMCINLSKDKSQRSEMDIAINALSDKQSNFDEHFFKQVIKQLEEKRESLIVGLSGLKEKYIRLKNLEYSDFIYDGKTISPLDAARYISDGENNYDYIQVKSKDIFCAFPLTYSDLQNLYELNYDISEQDEKIINSDLINLNNILTPDDFDGLIKIIRKDSNRKLNLDSSFQKELDNNEIENKLKIIASLLKELRGVEEFEVFFDLSLSNKSLSKLIQEELKQTQNLLLESFEYNYNKIKYKIEIDYTNLTKELVYEMSKIEDKSISNAFSGINKLLPIRNKIISIISSKLDLNKPDELKIINSTLKYELMLKDIKAQIKEYFKLINYDELDSENLENYENEITLILKSLELFAKISSNIGFIIDNGKLERLTSGKDSYYRKLIEILLITNSSLEDQVKINIYNTNLGEHNIYLNYLKSMRNYNSQMALLYESTLNMDSSNYNRTYEQIKLSKNKLEKLNEKSRLLKIIENVSEEMADCIRLKQGVHNTNLVPNKFFDAWKYSQLLSQMNELNEQNRNDYRELIKIQNQSIMKNAQKLAHFKAWLRNVNNLTLDQRRHVNEWKLIIRKVGAGKGKKAPMLLKQAREVMSKCQSAIPVWIMPLAQVVETFDPTKNKFDVIIIDEASQADILSLTALYLGKQVIIVGDDKQVSPSTIGIKDEVLYQLHNQYLTKIPSFNLYDDKRSLYDLAMLCNIKQVVLKEHFRCYPDIIGFSNKLYYNNEIVALRDNSKEIIKPSIVEYRVANGYRENSDKTNVNEADETINLLIVMLDMDEYKNKTFGIISMVGHEQSNYLKRRLFERVEVEIIEKRKITIGSPAHFQGDERDVILLNLVDSSETVRLISSGAFDGLHDKAYNVAASRAKDQLWVIHSLNPERDLQNIDLRFKLIQHARNPKISLNEAHLDKAESIFEKEVMMNLKGLGYKILPQHKVGGHRIDMIVYNGDKRIALECDGEAYHNEDNAEKDLSRQLRLERLGWSFIRLRGSMYFSNKSKGMKYVVEKLNENGIFPVLESEENNNNQSDLLDSIKVKVNQIRNNNGNDFKPYSLKVTNPIISINNPKNNKSLKTESIEHSKIPMERDSETSKAIEEILTRSINIPQTTEIEKLEIKLFQMTELNNDFVDLEKNILKAKQGDYIYHQSFGYGRILLLENENINVKLFLSKKIKKFKKDLKFFVVLKREVMIEKLVIN